MFVVVCITLWLCANALTVCLMGHLWSLHRQIADKADAVRNYEKAYGRLLDENHSLIVQNKELLENAQLFHSVVKSPGVPNQDEAQVGNA